MDEQEEGQVFALRILKTFDKENNAVNFRIDHKGTNIPMAEVLIIMEGWLKAEKNKIIGPLLRQK